ncbi:unnamed protein product [Phyllotreta striolata]|uniref:Fatty acid synthase n=1 Tax=Phyllotreta striolata TaxID=444603 RepID=A0A9N9THP0_PHYSR|nr:unnamed protein product [Phyllotreta striolata]
MQSDVEIVISGVSGRFPYCKDFEEFRDVLLDGIELPREEDTRHPRGIWGLPTRVATMNDVDKFDASFFNMHPKLAECTDPKQRILLETVFEAIVDSGYNPSELRGSNTGVYLGISSPTHVDSYHKKDTGGYTNLGYPLGMTANRISYNFDLRGPSLSLDTACSSGLYALVVAVNQMKAGLVDNAVVCAANYICHPHESLEFNRLNMLSPVGECKVFSIERDGYARSEAIVVYLLQKRRDCRRLYATILGAKYNSDGFKKEGVTFPSSEAQFGLMREVYIEADVDPNEVVFVEAHGTGTKVGDIQECEALTRLFCSKREAPLPIGAVKSNMGHSEISSGLCSLAKVVIAMETGVIPANIHLDKLDLTLPGICDNKLQVVGKNMKLEKGPIGMNCFGFGGANTHVILTSNAKEKTNNYKRPNYRLVQASGRTEEGLKRVFASIQSNRVDQEFLALIDEIHKTNIAGYKYRGYTVLGEGPVAHTTKYAGKRPVWFVYGGLGAQWNGMGRDLLNIEVFQKSIKRCAAALKTYEIDLLQILTSDDPTIFDDITNCICAIVALEIAFTDLLQSLGVVADGVVGHSIGEIGERKISDPVVLFTGCAYADGSVTAEQAILLAYTMGHVSKTTEMVRGQMACINLPQEKLLAVLPEDVYIACRNSKTNCTICGPSDEVMKLVNQLHSRGVHAKLINSCGVAYHTKYVTEAGKRLLGFCGDILNAPKPRSSKWVSSSVQSKETPQWAKLSCPEYFQNIMCNCVVFDQAYQQVPKDAIIVDMAPHGLLQNVLEKQQIHVALVDKMSENNERFFLNAIGKIYISGGQPNLRSLYPEVSFPVSRGTKMISPLIDWDHRKSWCCASFKNRDSFGREVTINLKDKKYSYLEGHIVDGKVQMPFAGYLELVWRMVADFNLKNIEEYPVVFKNVELKQPACLHCDKEVSFLVNVMSQSGGFEIFHNGSLACSGIIQSAKKVEFAHTEAQKPANPVMKREDVYKEFHMRQRDYEGSFQGVSEYDVSDFRGTIEWKKNFTSFIDAMFQVALLSDTSRDLVEPSFILKLVIDPLKHLDLVKKIQAIPVSYDGELNVVKSGGVEIEGIECRRVERQGNVQPPPVLESYEFVPYEAPNNLHDSDTSLRIAAAVVTENVKSRDGVKICEIDGQATMQKIKSILDAQSIISADYSSRSAKDTDDSEYDLIIADGNVDLKKIVPKLKETGFMLLTGDHKTDKTNLEVIYDGADGKIRLLRRRFELPKNYDIIHINSQNSDWIEDLKRIIHHPKSGTIYLLNDNQDISIIPGLTKCLQLEAKTKLNIKAICLDHKSPKFSTSCKFYKDQLEKNLTINVYKNNNWGTYVHLPLKEMESKHSENAAVQITTPGDLSTLVWIERPFKGLRTNNTDDLVYVHYSALNSTHVSLASGRLTGETKAALGMEFSGITVHGKRIMGLTSSESLALQTNYNRQLAWEVPKDWSLRDAATVPYAYSTCYYGLIIKGQLQPGESILIHAAAGGVGIAAINIAQSMGCRIFITVGSKEKRDFLKNLFPQLNDNCIGNSRDTSFEAMIKLWTKGRGVDMVVNSLKGPLFEASMRCLAENGRFVELGQMDRSTIPSKMFLRNIGFQGVQIDQVLRRDGDIKKEIHNLLSEGIAKNVVKPLPNEVYDANEIETAFRLAASGKHKGKILIELRKENSTTSKSLKHSIKARPKLLFDAGKTYVVVEDSDTLGLELTDWLLRNGAKKVVLNSKSTVNKGYQCYCFRKWSEYKNCVVKIDNNDTTTMKGAESLIKSANQLGPVGGIFNVSSMTRNISLSNQTKAGFEEEVTRRLASGSNLDAASRKLCKDIDYFVVFSSIASGRGAAGHSNSGMANSALEQICEKRRTDNLPALAVQFGPIDGERNVILDNEKPQTIESCWRVLETFMNQDSHVIVASTVFQDAASRRQRLLKDTPLEAVTRIIGVDDLDLVDTTITLAEIGVDDLLLAKIQSELLAEFSIDLKFDDLLNLTLDSFKVMENQKAI